VSMGRLMGGDEQRLNATSKALPILYSGPDVRRIKREKDQRPTVR